MSDLELYTQLVNGEFKSARNDRYNGGGFGLSLTDLDSQDVVRVRTAYSGVKALYDLWLYMRDEPNYAVLQTRLQNMIAGEFMQAVQNIGLDTYAKAPELSPAIRKAIHDIRGGGLTALLGYAQLIPRLKEKQETYLRQVVYLARDHAKMMRNILPDLDRAYRDADESLKVHHVREFIDKWQEFVFEMKGRQVRVTAVSHFDGFMTNRCLETSAIDRILYNYINNAARFSVSDEVRLTVIPLPNHLTRWVIENDINAEQKEWLDSTFHNDLRELFRGGHTRGGQGIGLSSCSDLVAASFGLPTATAVDQQYLGATVQNMAYYAWFHWPSYVRQNPDEPECDCQD